METPSLLPLFRTPAVNAVLSEPLADDATVPDAVRAMRKCIALFGDATRCFSFGGEDDQRCMMRYLNAQGCLGTVLEPRKHADLLRCMEERHDLNACEAPMIALQQANSKVLDAYADALVLQGPEETAWTSCGTLAHAPSADVANMVLGCSMSFVCPEPLERWLECTQGTGVDTAGACHEQGRQLLRAFRPYLEKVYFKDPLYLMRGTLIEAVVRQKDLQ